MLQLATAPPPDCTADKSLVYSDIAQRIRAHDPTGQAELHRLVCNTVRGYFLRRSPADAEELCQQFYLTLFEALQRNPVRDPNRLMAYVQTVLRRQYAAYVDNQVKRRSCGPVEEAVNNRSADIEEAVIADQERKIAIDILAKLKPRDREILLRFYLKEQPKEQIMREMHLSENQFRLVKSRAKAEFARRVQGCINGRRRTENK